MVYLPKGAEL